MQSFPNNGFYSYVRLLYHDHKIYDTNKFVFKLAQVLPVLVWETLKDAFVELLLLFIFWVVIMKMSQGRDLVISLFEPHGLYSFIRIFLTLLSVVSFSLSMWIIPAFLFEYREQRRLKNDTGGQDVFRKHLFFIHRVLPMIPFWLVASSVFYGNTPLTVLALSADGLLVFLYFFNAYIKNTATRKKVFYILLALFAGGIIYLFAIYHHTYVTAKIVFSILLYLLSLIMFFIYQYVDRQILNEHENGSVTGVNIFQRYRINSYFYTSLFIIHAAFVSYLLFTVIGFAIAPESMLLYIFSVYIFGIDLVFYLINISPVYRRVAVFVPVIILLLYVTGKVNLNTSHYALDPINRAPMLRSPDLLSFEDYYHQWTQRIINRADTTKPFPIILVSGEGGGSRAGLWFSQQLINFEYVTKGKFKDHIFSLSTVSGSSVGLSTVYSFWDFMGARDSIPVESVDLPEKVYACNFIGSAILGLTLKDLLKSLWPFSTFHTDRNNTLQDEEAVYTQQALYDLESPDHPKHASITDSNLVLKKDMLRFFYTLENGSLQFRKDRPMALINTCRSDDGRRGIFAPIRLDPEQFNDAIDMNKYIYCQSFFNTGTRKKQNGLASAVSLGQACNTSELFPFFSAPAYVHDLGSFVDGGYHENSGLKTTLDVYHKLKALLNRDLATIKPSAYSIYIVYLKNDAYSKDLYSRHEPKIPLTQPLTAVTNLPFSGNESYFEELARYTDANDPLTQYIRVQLDNNYVADSSKSTLSGKDAVVEKEIIKDLIKNSRPGSKDYVINFPLARWLSKSVIRRIKKNAVDLLKTNVQIKNMLKEIYPQSPDETKKLFVYLLQPVK